MNGIWMVVTYGQEAQQEIGTAAHRRENSFSYK